MNNISTISIIDELQQNGIFSELPDELNRNGVLSEIPEIYTFFTRIYKDIPSLSNFNNITKTINVSTFTISDPVSTSDGTFIFTSSNKSVATITGSTVTIHDIGETIITATQLETSSYMSATISAILTVIKMNPNLRDFMNISKEILIDTSFTIIAPSSDNNIGIFTYTSSNPSVGIISGSTVTINGIGETMITATQTETSNYTSATISAILTVTKTEAMLLKERGYTGSELKKIGYTAMELKGGGYTLKELLIQTNYRIFDLKEGGYVFNHSIILGKRKES